MSFWLTSARCPAAPPRCNLTAGRIASVQAHWSTGDQSVILRERGADGGDVFTLAIRGFGLDDEALDIFVVLFRVVELAVYDLGVHLARYSGFEVEVEAFGRFYRLVTKKLSHQFVFARPVL